MTRKNTRKSIAVSDCTRTAQKTGTWLDHLSDLTQYGEGTFYIYNREKGQARYQLVYHSMYDDNPEGERLSIIGSSLQECYAKMDAKKAECDERHRLQKLYEPGTLNAEFLPSFENWLYNVKKSPDLKANTFDRIETTFLNQIKPYKVFEGRRVRDITSAQLNTFLNFELYEVPIVKGKKTYQGLSVSSVKKAYDLLSQYFRYYYTKDPANNPMNSVKRPSKKRTEEDEVIDADRVLTDTEINLFKMTGYKEVVSGKPEGGSKYGKALMFMMLTFVRAGEMRALKWQDIDFKRKILTINKNVVNVKNRDGGEKKTKLVVTKPKTAAGIRKVHLTDEAIEIISDWRRETKYAKESDYILTTDTGAIITHEQLTRALKSILRRAGIEKESFGLHYLRHTGISYFLRHGISIDSISKMAGHSSTEVTRRIYYHIIEEQQEKAREEMNAIHRGA